MHPVAVGGWVLTDPHRHDLVPCATRSLHRASGNRKPLAECVCVFFLMCSSPQPAWVPPRRPSIFFMALPVHVLPTITDYIAMYSSFARSGSLASGVTAVAGSLSKAARFPSFRCSTAIFMFFATSPLGRPAVQNTMTPHFVSQRWVR